MKRKYWILILAGLILVAAICWMGIGYQSSSAAAADLTEQLIALHGEPYTGREVEKGRESMEISVQPDTFFFSNHGFRQMFNLDYRYRCEVTYTVRQGDEIVSQNTIRYVGIDPMGYEKESVRAYLEID